MKEAMQGLIEVLGEADAVRLVEALGGTRWALGRGRPVPPEWIVVLGEEKAAVLREAFRGEDLFIPKDSAVIDGLIYRDWAAGQNYNALALKWRLHSATIRKVVNRERERRHRAATGDLFEGLA